MTALGLRLDAQESGPTSLGGIEQAIDDIR